MNIKYVARVLSGAKFKKMFEKIDIIHEKTGKNKVGLFFDMIGCTLKYGAGYNDYIIFEFYNMNAKERKTYLTRMKNKKLVTTLNDLRFSHIFDEKNLFDEKALEVNAISNYLTADTPLPQYLPYARFLLDTDLSHTAKLLYTLLLDRATLSQKNNWMDECGFVYVIFPLSSLSDALRCSTMSIKRALRSLEDSDLIERRRGHIAVPNNIFVKVPTEQKCSSAWNDSAPCDGTEMISSMEQKCSTNQRNKNDLKNNHLIKTTDAYLTFGEYQNVFLTAKEYRRLKADFFGLDSLIEQLSAYIQPTGKKYADHAATLRIWAKRQKTERKSTPGIPDYTFTEGESL